jgi:hypothetical protein
LGNGSEKHSKNPENGGKRNGNEWEQGTEIAETISVENEKGAKNENEQVGNPQNNADASKVSHTHNF